MNSLGCTGGDGEGAGTAGTEGRLSAFLFNASSPKADVLPTAMHHSCKSALYLINHIRETRHNGAFNYRNNYQGLMTAAV